MRTRDALRVAAERMKPEKYAGREKAVGFGRYNCRADQTLGAIHGVEERPAIRAGAAGGG